MLDRLAEAENNMQCARVPEYSDEKVCEHIKTTVRAIAGSWWRRSLSAWRKEGRREA